MLDTAKRGAATATVDSLRGYPAGHAVTPYISDYGAFRAAFSWERARRDLDGLPAGGLNIAYEAVDHHAAGARASKVALRWLGRNGAVQDYACARLGRPSNRFANVLKALGVGMGERNEARKETD